MFLEFQNVIWPRKKSKALFDLKNNKISKLKQKYNLIKQKW